jgi:hypothetical protein
LTVHYTRRLRYVCERALGDYAEPICQGVSGEPLDAFVAEQVLLVLQPASLELSLAAEADLCGQHRQLEQRWKQRLDRAAFEADRAARQYSAVEPENRLVARTLERRWEEALVQQREAEEEYDRFQRDQPGELNAAQRDAILHLSEDVSRTWHSATTTVQDRQEIVRLLLDRVVVNVRGNSEQMDIHLHWAGGAVSSHCLVRNVSRYKQLSNYHELCKRVKTLRAQGESLANIAESLNRAGFFPPKRTGRFSAGMVGELLVTLGVPARRPWSDSDSYVLQEHEHWLGDLARKLGVSINAMRNWQRFGWIHSRRIQVAGGRWAVWADADEVSRLQSLEKCSHTGKIHSYPAELKIPKAPRCDA